MDNFLNSELITTIVRLLTALAGCTMFYYSVKSLIRRRITKLIDFADWVLVVVSGYWAIYTVYVVVIFDGVKIPPLEFYIFNMRFGLLITLSALVPLIKDRLLVSDLFHLVQKQKDIMENSNESDV